MSNNTKNRIPYIDILKSLSIFAVVLGHVCQNYSRDIELYVEQYCIFPWNMPLFAVISGMFFKAETTFTFFLKRKVLAILVPFVVWCFIYFVVFRSLRDLTYFFLYNQSIHVMAWLNNFLYALFDWGWWYLRAFFLSLIYAFCAVKLFRSKTLISMIVSVLILWSFSFLGIIPNKYPLTLGFVFLYPFFASGIVLKKQWNKIESHSALFFWISFLVFSLLMCFWKGYPDTFYVMNTSVFEAHGRFDVIGYTVVQKTIYRFMVGFTGSLSIILFFRKLNYPKIFVHVMQPIGENTLGIYILHCFFFDIFEKHQVCNNACLSFVFAISISFVIVFICRLIVVCTSRFNMCRKVLWGKLK